MRTLIQRIEFVAERHPQLAVQLYEKYEQELIQQGRMEEAIDVFVNRFFIQDKMGQIMDLLPQIQNALHNAESLGLTLQASKLMLCLGTLYCSQALYQDSIHFWSRAIELCKISDDKRTLAHAQIGMARIFDALNDFKTAYRFHLEAACLAQSLEGSSNNSLKSKQLLYQSVHHFLKDEFDIAKELLNQALVFAEEAGRLKYVSEIQYYLARIEKARDHQDSSLYWVHKSRYTSEKTRCTRIYIRANNLIGEWFHEQHFFKDAIFYYQQSYAQAKHIGSLWLQAECCHVLSILFEKLGHISKALNAEREYTDLKKQIDGLRSTENFLEIRDYDLLRPQPVQELLTITNDHALDKEDLPNVLHHIFSRAIQLIKVDILSFWHLDPENQLLRCDLAAGLVPSKFENARSLTRHDFPQYYRLIEENFSTITSYSLNSHPAANELRRLYQNTDLRSIMDIPVRLHGEHIGFISFGKLNHNHFWTKDDVLFGSYLANLVQQALSHEKFKQIQSELESRVQVRTMQLQQQTEVLKSTQQHIFLLGEIGREITAQLNREAIISTVFEHVNLLIQADAFSIGIYHPEKNIIHFPCNIIKGHRALPYNRDMDKPNQLSVWCVKNRKPIFINHIQEEYTQYMEAEGLQNLIPTDSFPKDLTSLHSASFIYAPLIIKDKVLGLLSVQSEAPYVFDKVHLDILTTLASYTAVAFENADTYQQLSSAQQMLMSKEKLAALGSLVAGVAHEINTPIGNCLLTTTTMKEQTKDFIHQFEAGTLKKSGVIHFTKSLNEVLDILVRNLNNASDLISSFKQVSVDQTSQHRRIFNLSQTTHEVVRTISNKIQKSGHCIHIQIPDDIFLESYPGPFGQVISNLINNAMTHGFENREHGTMTLTAYIEDLNLVRIDFHDNGKGISPENLSRVFDPFFTTKLGKGGSGLGLNIVHNIVKDLLGGSIEIQSEIDKGTTFTISLPLRFN